MWANGQIAMPNPRQEPTSQTEEPSWVAVRAASCVVCPSRAGLGGKCGDLQPNTSPFAAACATYDMSLVLVQLQQAQNTRAMRAHVGPYDRVYVRGIRTSLDRRLFAQLVMWACLTPIALPGWPLCLVALVQNCRSPAVYGAENLLQYCSVWQRASHASAIEHQHTLPSTCKNFALAAGLAGLAD